MDPILRFLEEHRSKIVDDLRRFVELETPSKNVELLNICAGAITNYVESLGARTELVEGDGYGKHVRAEWSPSAGEKPIVMIGHYDTVWPSGTLARLPFRVEDGVARGPGVFDMKAGWVQGLWAIRALRYLGRLNRHIVFLFNSDEEVGSVSSRELIETEARKAAAVLVLEPSLDGKIKTARKGVGMFEVEIVGRPAHAGSDLAAGISAIDELARVILELHALTDFTRGTTVNVGVVQGGTARNVVAERASALIDVRVTTLTEAERITERINALRPHNPEAKIQVSGGLNRPPMERSDKIAALAILARELAKELGFVLDETSTGGGSDGNFAAALGAAVLDGLGAVGAGSHAIHEHVIVEEMPRRAALVAKLIQNL